MKVVDYYENIIKFKWVIARKWVWNKIESETEDEKKKNIVINISVRLSHLPKNFHSTTRDEPNKLYPSRISARSKYFKFFRLQKQKKRNERREKWVRKKNTVNAIFFIYVFYPHIKVARR